MYRSILQNAEMFIQLHIWVIITFIDEIIESNQNLKITIRYQPKNEEGKEVTALNAM